VSEVARSCRIFPRPSQVQAARTFVHVTTALVRVVRTPPPFVRIRMPLRDHVQVALAREVRDDGSHTAVVRPEEGQAACRWRRRRRGRGRRRGYLGAENGVERVRHARIDIWVRFH
jgi:hypothetical protein